MKNGWDFADANCLVRGSWICRFFDATINRIEAATRRARVTRFYRERARDFTDLPSRRRFQLVVWFSVAAVLAQMVVRSVTPTHLLPAAPALLGLDVLLGGLATLLWIARNASAITFEESQRRVDDRPQESV